MTRVTSFRVESKLSPIGRTNATYNGERVHGVGEWGPKDAPMSIQLGQRSLSLKRLAMDMNMIRSRVTHIWKWVGGYLRQDETMQ